jgi:hypothetical protein
MPRSRVISFFTRSFSLEDLLVDAAGTEEKYDYRYLTFIKISYESRMSGFSQ